MPSGLPWEFPPHHGPPLLNSPGDLAELPGPALIVLPKAVIQTISDDPGVALLGACGGGCLRSLLSDLEELTGFLPVSGMLYTALIQLFLTDGGTA